MARKRNEIEQALRGPVQPLGYQQCEWSADNRRCRYPGTVTTNLHEGGPYYCRLHFACKDPTWGAQVVDASLDYSHPTQAQTLSEHTALAKAALKAKGLDRKPGEALAAWTLRCRDYLRQTEVLKTMRDAA